MEQVNKLLIERVSETRYLGTYVTAGRGFRCSVTHAKRCFSSSHKRS